MTFTSPRQYFSLLPAVGLALALSSPALAQDGPLSVARDLYASARYDEYGDEMLEDDETLDGREEVEEEAFGGEEEELGLDDIEQDIGEEEDLNEE